MAASSTAAAVGATARRRARASMTAAAVALLLFAGSPPEAAAAGGYSPLVGDQQERRLLENVRAEKLIRAREQAERILGRRPDSLIARFALARVFLEEEGNLPRALFHARRAERLLLRLFGDPPRDQAAQDWHRKLLKEQEAILGELDRRQDQLAVLDRHDALYRPPLDYRRIWALMKLRRFDAASSLAKKVSLSSDLPTRISGLNGMIAIEMERERPLSCFKVGMKSVRDTGFQSCILLHNTAEAAFAVYNFAEVERLALKALQAPLKDCPNSPYPHLASLYLLRGDFQRAMEAVRSAREQGIRRRYRQQFEMVNTAWLFRLLYVLGKFDTAQELSQRVLRTPDRVGMTSLSKEMTRLAAAVEYHAGLRAYMESIREQASVRPVGERIKSWLALRRLDHKAWVARRRASRLLTYQVAVKQVVRPYLSPLLPWSLGALIEVAGEGVILRGLKQARASETMKRQSAPYFDALEGEVHYRAGDLPRALELARKSAATLPRDEVLLRGRVQAWAADAAWRLGRRREAGELYHQVLSHFPTALRILEIPLPARVLGDGAPISREVARQLLRSRRLTPLGKQARHGFAVRVSSLKDQTLRLCLEGQAGQRYACVSISLPVKVSGKPVSETEQVAQVIDRFHSKVFAPKVDLTQREINSLDGTAVKGDADQLIKEVLGP